MQALDTDQGINGQLSFSILGDQKTLFGVRRGQSPQMAELYTTATAFAPLTRSSVGVFQFNSTFKLPVTVKVQDSGIPSLSTNCFLWVTISTINMYAPVFDYSQYTTVLFVPSSASTRVTRVFAVDPDFGVNATVTYSLNASETNCNTYFSIEATSGWISTKIAIGTMPVSVSYYNLCFFIILLDLPRFIALFCGKKC